MYWNSSFEMLFSYEEISQRLLKYIDKFVSNKGHSSFHSSVKDVLKIVLCFARLFLLARGPTF